jgi:hypothetical protein
MESLFKRTTSTYRGSTTLSFFSPCYALCLGHFEFKTLLTSRSAFSKRPTFFCTRSSNWLYMRNWHKQVFFFTKKILHSAKLQATIQMAGFLRVPPKSSFKKLLLGTGLWQHAKMSTSLKSPDRLKDAECEKGQLSHRPSIPHVPVRHCHPQGRTPDLQDQAFRCITPQHAHLLPWEQ